MKWSTIILEAYCGRKWSLEGEKYLYEILANGKTRKVPNKYFYNPKYRTPRAPKWCPKDAPGFICLEKKCPHLAYSNAAETEYRHDSKYWRKK